MNKEIYNTYNKDRYNSAYIGGGLSESSLERRAKKLGLSAKQTEEVLKADAEWRCGFYLDIMIRTGDLSFLERAIELAKRYDLSQDFTCLEYSSYIRNVENCCSGENVGKAMRFVIEHGLPIERLVDTLQKSQKSEKACS